MLAVGQQPQGPHHLQLLQDGACVPPKECRCTLDPTVPGALNLSREEQEQEHAPGSRLQHRCNTWCVPPAPLPHPTAAGCWMGSEPFSVRSVCIRGAFNCSQEECDGEDIPFLILAAALRSLCHIQALLAPPPAVDCLWSPWSPWSPCSVTCGMGEQLSHRHPLRQRLYEGAECLGAPVRRTPCHLPDCGECPRCPQVRLQSHRAAKQSVEQDRGDGGGEEPSSMCRRFTELRNITKGPCSLPNVEVSFCSGRCPSRTAVTPEEPYLQTLCECCSYRLDPRSPVRILSLPCAGGAAEPVVLPIIRSCECSSCQGGDFSKR
ncbi:hypothetical protein ASZ78_003682 [Callipepla squamata]|uniref:CTCK domain-containing protein n=1 Tax=Callipepla squamata TaxID=9009 RepID=A0A226N9G9_CALSU|nr:hypothetical protein ASZ78_003682 [Callipepla squamata]